ncbi:MAG: HlyD family efflux transporter periplasmic adaptor subunit [Candidatus Cloacimonetes bacterium]|jgi:HlyD family secretion protein|nr:HlyD family efflux transporter periplasmic adaptor subunit [Candidatus Cloacimonadota bacterium]
MDKPRANPKRKRKPFYIAGGVVVAALITLGLSQLKPAPPGVERAAIWVDTVQRGPMVREVRGPGTLVPEDIWLIPAITAGRVDEIYARPGTQVQAGTPLLRLSNPDVELQLLEAERQLRAAESELVSQRSTLETQILNQEATIAQVQSLYNTAVRDARSADDMAEKGLIARNEADARKDALHENKVRLEVEQKRLELMREQLEEQVSAQQAQVDRLRSIVRFRRQELESMNVVSPAEGVLQRLDLEIGQWVNPGVELARVVQPGRLKAELRIPEVQAKDVAIGQLARIDTRNGIVEGRVVRIDPASQNGSVGVDVALDGELPPGARPDLSVDGTIEIERLPDVLFVGRPAFGNPESSVGMFKVTPDFRYADRVTVQLGRNSVNTIEVRGGLQEGDVVILSDMSQWDSHPRVRIQ